MTPHDPTNTVAFLTANTGEAELVASILAEHGWTCLLAHDRAALEGVLFSQDCHGVILGLSTIVHLDPADREFIVALEPAYPVARLRLNGQGGVLIASALAGLDSTLDTFLNVCASWPRRRLRSSERAHCFLRGDMRSEGGLTERIFSLNISETGAFVHVDGDWPLGMDVILEFPLGPDFVKVNGRIVRVVSWAESGQAPGVAVRFGAEVKKVIRLLLKEDRKHL